MITFFFILYFDRASSTRAAVPQPVPGTGLFSVEAVFADTEKDLLKRVSFRNGSSSTRTLTLLLTCTQ
jgi:hypothetical protein